MIPTKAPGARRLGTGRDLICHNDMKEYLEKEKELTLTVYQQP